MVRPSAFAAFKLITNSNFVGCSIDDLMRFPSVSPINFLECSGNTQNWKSVRPEFTVQDTHGLVMMMSTLLEEVGINPEAK